MAQTIITKERKKILVNVRIEQRREGDITLKEVIQKYQE